MWDFLVVVLAVVAALAAVSAFVVALTVRREVRAIRVVAAREETELADAHEKAASLAAGATARHTRRHLHVIKDAATLAVGVGVTATAGMMRRVLEHPRGAILAAAGATTAATGLVILAPNIIPEDDSPQRPPAAEAPVNGTPAPPPTQTPDPSTPAPPSTPTPAPQTPAQTPAPQPIDGGDDPVGDSGQDDGESPDDTDPPNNTAPPDDTGPPEDQPDRGRGQPGICVDLGVIGLCVPADRD